MPTASPTPPNWRWRMREGKSKCKRTGFLIFWNYDVLLSKMLQNKWPWIHFEDPSKNLGSGLCKWSTLGFELPHLPVNPQLSGNIFDISNLFCFLIPNSGPTLSASPLEVFPDPQSLGGFPPIGIELASSILCLNLQFSLSQQPWLHPKFTPSPFLQWPQIFEVRAHFFSSCNTQPGI